MNNSRVIFDELEHTYTLEGEKLKGITGILSRRLFQNKYSGIPDHILKNAAKKGNDIHSEVQMYEEGFYPSNPSDEFKAYIKLKEDKGFTVSEKEYIVTDGFYASPIDLVIGYNGLALADIKTTAILDTEYLSWQLSIYKYLFEIQNPELTVAKLYGIHLKGDNAKMVEVPIIDKSIIIELLEADKADREFINPLKQLTKKEDEMLERLYDIEQFIIEAEAEVKAKKELQTKYKDELLKLMDERGVKSLETDNLKITRKADSVRQSIDSKSLKENEPLIYEKYLKESNVKGSIILTVKNC
jgi:hypothetical protein